MDLKFGEFLKLIQKLVKRMNLSCFHLYIKNSLADKSQMTVLKYTLGVNKYSSNLAVLSETDRLPMPFSVIISIVKYFTQVGKFL